MSAETHTGAHTSTHKRHRAAVCCASHCFLVSPQPCKYVGSRPKPGMYAAVAQPVSPTKVPCHRAQSVSRPAQQTYASHSAPPAMHYLSPQHNHAHSTTQGTLSEHEAETSQQQVGGITSKHKTVLSWVTATDYSHRVQPQHRQR